MLHLDHLQELAAAAQEVIQFLLLGRRQGPWFRLHPKGKLGQDPGIDLIGLGQDAQRASKIPHLTGIDQYRREAGGHQGRHYPVLVATAGLQKDDLGGPAAEAFQHFGQAGVCISHGEGVALGEPGEVQTAVWRCQCPR